MAHTLLMDNGTPRPAFARRRLDSGSVESICMGCFLTISHTWGDFKVTEKELVEIEASHQCDETREVKTVLEF